MHTPHVTRKNGKKVSPIGHVDYILFVTLGRGGVDPPMHTWRLESVLGVGVENASSQAIISTVVGSFAQR